MDFIKNWTLNVSITLVIAVVLSLLTPKGSIGRFYKIILSTFIVFSFITPFLNSSIELVIPDLSIVENDENQTVIYEEMVANQIRNKLEEKDYSSCNVSCKISIKSDEIYIDKIKVSIPDAYDKEAVRELIFDDLGLNSEVYYLGE